MKDEIEQLAQSLKNSGLAASIEDARKKAEEMLGGKNKGQDIKVGAKEEKPAPKEELSQEPMPKEEPKEAEEPKPEPEEEPSEEEKPEEKEEKQTELFVNKEAEDEMKGKGLSEEDKKKTDLTKLFNFGNK